MNGSLLVLLPLLLGLVWIPAPRLAEAGSDLDAVRAALLLGWLVEPDPTLAVRVGAAAGPGRVRAKEAWWSSRSTRCDAGEPCALRNTLAISLARRKSGPRALLRAADARRRPRAERLLSFKP